MVRIRLTRTGKKNNPSYRISVTPQREKRETNFIELIGHFSPITKVLEINEERAKYWLSVGAQPSDTVRSLFVKKGLLKPLTFKRTRKDKAGKKTTDRAK